MYADFYVVGQRLRIKAQFKVGGVLTDPSVVRFQFRKPTDTVTTSYVYGVNGELVRESLGKYYVDLDLSEAGTWRIRYESTGTVVSAGQFKFKVKAEDPA